MEKLLFIAPHLSTGGLPQFLLKKIQLLISDYDVYLIEYENITGGKLVVQRYQLENTLGPERFYTLGENKEEDILKIISLIDPDIIHLEEIPEFFLPDSISDKIYSETRKYKIFETSHDSSYDVSQKRYQPDKFLFVSNSQTQAYKSLGIDQVVIEYPIEYRQKTDRVEALSKLSLDQNKKHILHVGLYTTRKNQKEFFEYARLLPDFQFHSVGNQADNFSFYWEPLLSDKPDNVTVWGERSDVDLFYDACDLFLFTSKGDNHDKETMPLVIREAISWKLPILIYNLEVYNNYFDSFPNVSYLTQDKNENSKMIKEILGYNEEPIVHVDSTKKCLIVDAFISSPDKEDLLLENLRSMRKFGYDIFLVSHSHVSERVTSEVDYFLFDRDNTFNNNHVYSWRKDGDTEIRINIRKSHEWPIIRSMRLAFNTAKSLGYEYFLFSEFDHHYADRDVERVREIIGNSIAKDNEFVFWAPQEKVDYGGYGNETGIFYETCFFAGYLDSFLSVFESSFPKTLEEYNDRFASSFPNSLEFWFWKYFTPLADKTTVIPNYVKLDLKDSEINVSSYQNFRSIILPSKKAHFLYITNDNFIDYDFTVYVDNEKKHEFTLNRFYKLIKLDRDCSIRINSFSSGKMFQSETIEYRKSESDEYQKNGEILFNQGEHDMFTISFEPAENKVYIDYNEDQRREVLVSIKDIDSKSTIWSFKNLAENKSRWWCVPTPKHVLDYQNQINFGGFIVDIFENDQKIYSDSIRIKKSLVFKPEMDVTITEPIFSNYNEFFVDKIYSHLDVQSLDVVFDIGANVGLWTEWILRQNASRVYCFEPNRVALEVLRRLHGGKENVEIIDKAVDSEVRTIEFFYSDSNSLISATEKHGELNKSYEVSTITIADAIQKYGVKHIDLIKMDIEGAEFKIFESLDDSIYEITDAFLIEFHAFYYSDGKVREERIIEKMKEKGYFVENHPGGIFATKHKKCFYVNNSAFALDVPGKGSLEKINLYNGAADFSWDKLSQKSLIGYHHAYHEMFFYDGSSTGCVYEIDECKIEEGDIVLDAGANIGIFTNYAYRKGAKKIYSFEPCSEAFQALIVNSGEIAETYKLGLSFEPGSEKLYYEQGNTMSSSVKYGEGEFEHILVESIDSLHRKNLFERLDFLKIDAEGSEIDILNGAREMLSEQKIKKISFEYHSSLFDSEYINRLCEDMISYGYLYRCEWIDDNISFYYFWLE